MPTNNIVYNEYADPYDVILLNWSSYLELRDLHLDMCKKGKIVLDLGTGTGNQAVELIKQGKVVHAIDINPQMMKYIFEKIEVEPTYMPNIAIYLMDAEKLRFKNREFDAVTSMNLIYNLPHPEDAMREAYRVLKPGGVFSLSGPLPPNDIDVIVGKIKHEMKQKKLYNENVDAMIEQMRKANEHLVGNATLYTASQLEEILTKKIGFKEIITSTEKPYLGNAYFVAVRK